MVQIQAALLTPTPSTDNQIHPYLNICPPLDIFDSEAVVAIHTDVGDFGNELADYIHSFSQGDKGLLGGVLSYGYDQLAK